MAACANHANVPLSANAIAAGTAARRPTDRRRRSRNVARARDDLEQHPLVELAVAQQRQQRRREQRRGLHVPGQRRPGRLIGVPPRPAQVEPVQDRPVRQRLRDEPVVGVDRRLAGQRPGDEGADQAAARPERIGVEDPEDVREVREHDRGHDDQQRPGVGRQPPRRRAARVPALGAAARAPACRRGASRPIVNAGAAARRGNEAGSRTPRSPGKPAMAGAGSMARLYGSRPEVQRRAAVGRHRADGRRAESR